MSVVSRLLGTETTTEVYDCYIANMLHVGRITRQKARTHAHTQREREREHTRYIRRAWPERGFDVGTRHQMASASSQVIKYGQPEDPEVVGVDGRKRNLFNNATRDHPLQGKYRFPVASNK